MHLQFNADYRFLLYINIVNVIVQIKAKWKELIIFQMNA